MSDNNEKSQRKVTIQIYPLTWSAIGWISGIASASLTLWFQWAAPILVQINDNTRSTRFLERSVSKADARMNGVLRRMIAQGNGLTRQERLFVSLSEGDIPAINKRQVDTDSALDVIIEWVPEQRARTDNMRRDVDALWVSTFGKPRHARQRLHDDKAVDSGEGGDK